MWATRRRHEGRDRGQNLLLGEKTALKRQRLNQLHVPHSSLGALDPRLFGQGDDGHEPRFTLAF